MSDIVTFIRDRVGDDERIALAASEGPWKVNSTNYPEYISDAKGLDVVSGGRWGGEASIFSDDADAFHIARHDPSRVLREVAAKRAIIKAEFANLFDMDGEWGDGCDSAKICRGECRDVANLDDCQTFRALAAAYSDHPDYRQEWAI